MGPASHAIPHVNLFSEFSSACLDRYSFLFPPSRIAFLDFALIGSTEHGCSEYLLRVVYFFPFFYSFYSPSPLFSSFYLMASQREKKRDMHALWLQNVILSTLWGVFFHLLQQKLYVRSSNGCTQKKKQKSVSILFINSMCVILPFFIRLLYFRNIYR